MDVRHRLAEVQAPTLVLHSRDDQLVPASHGQEIAAGIPGARLIGLPSKNHILLAEDRPSRASRAKSKTFSARTVDPGLRERALGRSAEGRQWP